MPIGIRALTSAALAIGMAEFVIVGILPQIAQDMQLSLATAGLTVSIYALAVAVAAPLLTALTGRIGRKRLILGLMALFIVANTLSALAPGFATLLLGRILSGAVQGVFYSVATVVAAGLVPKARAGQAIATMFTGITLALISGVPLGTFVANAFGWRATFLAVTGIGGLSMLALALLLPREIEKPAALPFAEQMAVVLKPRLALLFAITLVGYGGSFVAFTYLSPILARFTGLSPNGIGTLLFFYGIAVAIGNLLCARAADRSGAMPVLLAIYAVMALALFLLIPAAGNLWTVTPLVMIWGIVAFGSVSILQLYAVNQAGLIAPRAVNATSSMNISAFNLGIALGAGGGGWVVDHLGLGLTGPVAGVVVLAGLGLAALSGLLDRRHCAALRAGNGGSCPEPG
ncbi:MFS transporter [Pseudooceanicola sp. CBS1P-1]|uniref:MFS transporter n=1 Tax=Pseudooceanicola albus TaxID=2692189 RepID=A0A6L7G9I5_9RHOB|nr:MULTISPECIES: MFS transporter [Pseudooceanicola]MBT9384470.1 MFS transporter [Pseudooceanicola endophyticus]MXN20629.1 MFS transporter [Pseudooceanicola albus]